MPVLEAADLTESHPNLPTEWRRSMAGIKRRGGPWACHSCPGPSFLSYRCSKCGTLLTAGSGRGER